MISGREGVAAVEEAINALRGDEGRVDAALQSAVADAARFRQQETEGFRQLARVKLDLMANSSAVDALDQTERRALDLVRASRSALESITRHRADAAASVVAAEAAEKEKAAALEAAIKAADLLREQVEGSVRGDPAWQAAKAALDTAVSVADAADTKAASAETDLASKRTPYENDPLFMYLWTRKHGSSEDESGGIVRFFDRKVANLVGYQDARANYAMLLEIPDRLKQHALDCHSRIDAAKVNLAATERKALEAAGIVPLEQAVADAEAAVTAAREQVVQSTAALQSVDAERQKAMASDDPAYTQAVDLLAQGLQHEDMRRLYAEAFKTPTPADEQALNAITRARDAAAAADAEVARIRQQITDLAQRRHQLEISRDQARAQGYDSPWGTFTDHSIISGVISGIVQGAMTAIELNQAMQSQYRQREPRSDPNFGAPPGSSGPSFFPTPWSGPGATPTPPAQSGWRTGGSF